METVGSVFEFFEWGGRVVLGNSLVRKAWLARSRFEIAAPFWRNFRFLIWKGYGRSYAARFEDVYITFAQVGVEITHNHRNSGASGCCHARLVLSFFVS